jgi:hypothetical protein
LPFGVVPRDGLVQPDHTSGKICENLTLLPPRY